MKLAVRKDVGGVPGGGYHYMLHPMAMTSDQEAGFFRLMGYDVVEVEDPLGTRLLQEGRAALRHQVEAAYLVDGPKPK